MFGVHADGDIVLCSFDLLPLDLLPRERAGCCSRGDVLPVTIKTDVLLAKNTKRKGKYEVIY